MPLRLSILPSRDCARGVKCVRFQIRGIVAPFQGCFLLLLRSAESRESKATDRTLLRNGHLSVDKEDRWPMRRWVVVVVDLESDAVPRTDVVPKAAHIASDLDAFLQVRGGAFLCEFVGTKISARVVLLYMPVIVRPVIVRGDSTFRVFSSCHLRNAFAFVFAVVLHDQARFRDGETVFKHTEVPPIEPSYDTLQRMKHVAGADDCAIEEEAVIAALQSSGLTIVNPDGQGC